MKFRLGLCCQFIKAPIDFRTTTARYLQALKAQGKNPLGYLSDLILSNSSSLIEALKYCHTHQIGCFRINSQFLPLYTHPSEGYSLDLLRNSNDLEFEQLPATTQILEILGKAKKYAEEHHIRLTFHPDQFVVLNSPKEDVVAKSIEELEYHGMLAELLGADVINIHAGGGYQDKLTSLERFAKNFDRLSPCVKSRLTIENDDKIYTPSDLLPLCEKVKIPLVYDVHHHRCHPDLLSIQAATEKAIATWDREPLFHLSSPKEGWQSSQPRLHADFIDPSDFPKAWKNLAISKESRTPLLTTLTIEIEAKGKELAVEKLLHHSQKINPQYH